MRVDKSKCKEITKVPNIKSAKKRVLVNQKKNEQNKMIKNEVKTAIKKVDLLVKEGKLDDAKALLPAPMNSVSICLYSFFRAGSSSEAVI